MNIKEWYNALENGIAPREYDIKSRKIQQSLIYNTDPNATVRHHLMDTPEQIEYNKNHYEMWGHNLDGTFEYGKYMIFVTPEEHRKLHDVSGENNPMYGKHHTLETKLKIGNKNRGHVASLVTRQRLSKALKRRPPISDETRHRLSVAVKNSWKNDPDRKHSLSLKMSGKNNPMYGRTGELSPAYGRVVSDETRQKLHDANVGKHVPNCVREKISESVKNLWTDEKREAYSNRMKASMTDEHRNFLRESQKRVMLERSIMYKIYKDLGGTLTWHDFRRK